MATAQPYTSSSSSTPPNAPSNTEINSIIPGTIFPDDSSLSSFIDSGDLSYDSPTLSPSSSSPPHNANKSGGGGGGGSNGGGGGGGGDHIGQIEVNSTIQTILVVLGFSVGVLFLLGVVAMYYITHKNLRAEEKKKKQREDESASVNVGRSSTSLPPSSSSSSSSLPLPSRPNISAGTGTAAAAVGRENPAHRIIITRSMTATTANTRVGAGGPNDEKDNGGGSGGLSPIGDGKSDMVTIYIDEMPDDDEIRARHHCDDDGDGGCREKQELDEKEEDEENPSQERNQKLTDAFPSPHNSL